MEGKRKSEIIIVKDRFKGVPDAFGLTRVSIDLPWDRLEDAMGFCSENVLVDITGVLDEVERFKDALWSVKNTQDYIDGKHLLKGEE